MSPLTCPVSPTYFGQSRHGYVHRVDDGDETALWNAGVNCQPAHDEGERPTEFSTYSDS